jgi:uracil-DNA glycosylase
MQKPLIEWPTEWESIVNACRRKDYFSVLFNQLEDMRSKGVVFSPSFSSIIKPFQLISPSEVKVVILGSEPYLYRHQATGIPFGIKPGSELPKTLVNIINEIESDMIATYQDDHPYLNFSIDRSNVTLEGWVKQGVLLLNRVMTVEEGKIGSHYDIGWQNFTNDIVYALRDNIKALVLWGTEAHKVEKDLSDRLHGGSKPDMLILKSSHPNPISYNRGLLDQRFLGCGHFCKINEHLGKLYAKQKCKKPIKETIYKPINWLKTGGN